MGCKCMGRALVRPFTGRLKAHGNIQASQIIGIGLGATSTSVFEFGLPANRTITYCSGFAIREGFHTLGRMGLYVISQVVLQIGVFFL